MEHKKRMSLALAAVALACGIVSAKETGTAEKTWSLTLPLKGPASLRVENLLGTVKVRGTSAEGTVKVDVRVATEAATQDEATALASGVTVDTAKEGAVTAVRVGLSGGTAAPTIRLPREKGHAVSRWMSSLFGKKGQALDVEYRGSTYRIADDRKSPGLAVELTLTVPFGAAIAVRQEVGSIVIESSRGDARLEARAGSIEVVRYFGSLTVDGQDAEVSLTSFQGTKLDVATRAGSIELLEVRARKASLRTESGAIHGKTSGADDLVVSSGTGSVTLADTEPVSAEIRTGAGDVDVSSYLTRTHKVVVRSETGNVVLRLGETIGFDLTAETPKGEVKSLGFAMTAVEKSGNVSRYQRSGGGPDLDVRAAAGSLTVRPFGVSRLGLLARKSES